MPRSLEARIRAPHDLADLGHAAGGAVDLGGGDGLYGVHDQEAGLDGVQVAEDRGQIGLGGEIQMVVDRLDAVGAHPDLAGRLLARDVEGAVLVAGGLGGDVEQEGGLADAGLARDQDDGAGDEAPAEDPVELGHAGGAGGGLPGVDLADRDGGRRDPAGRGRPHGGRAVLLDRPPRLALAAATQPFRRLPAALGAAVGRPVLAGFRTGSHAPNRNRDH